MSLFNSIMPFFGGATDTDSPSGGGSTGGTVDASARKLYLNMSSLERSRIRQIANIDTQTQEVLDYKDKNKYPVKWYNSETKTDQNRPYFDYAYTEWVQILGDAQSAVANPANDRFTNYVLYNQFKGGIKVQELNDLPKSYEIRPGVFVDLSLYQNRIPYIDALEPRPWVSRRDYAAISIMNAGFIYAIAGSDTETIGGYTGYQYAQAVRGELLWYANKKPDFDYTRRDRFPIDSNQVFDRNPIFFWACHINTLLSAYDYTKTSTVYSASDHKIISNWFAAATYYYYYNWQNPVTSGRFAKGEEGNYNNPVGGTIWNDRAVNSKAWDSATWQKWGFSEAWANRSCAIWRFFSRASIFLYQWRKHNYETAKIDEIATVHIKRIVKEFLAYFVSKDGYLLDLCRTGYTQVGIGYAWDIIGTVIDCIDTYERNMYDTDGFESLYEWELTQGLKSTYYTVPTKGWAQQVSPNPNHKRDFLTVLYTLAIMHDQNNRSRYSSRRGGYINGFDGGGRTNIMQMDVFSAPAMMYYGAKHPTDFKTNIIKSVYTRQNTGALRFVALRNYVDAQKIGSYEVQNGVWGGYSGVWLQFGYLENSQFNPYIDSNFS